jgi:hypothetical protein
VRHPVFARNLVRLTSIPISSWWTQSLDCIYDALVQEQMVVVHGHAADAQIVEGVDTKTKKTQDEGKEFHR